eukprot:gene708-879_t
MCNKIERQLTNFLLATTCILAPLGCGGVRYHIGEERAPQPIEQDKSYQISHLTTEQPIITSKGGHKIEFLDNQLEEACIKVNLPEPFSQELKLPIYKEHPSLSVKDILMHSSEWHRNNLHVQFPTSQRKGHLYIGSMGLRGGGSSSSKPTHDPCPKCGNLARIISEDVEKRRRWYTLWLREHERHIKYHLRCSHCLELEENRSREEAQAVSRQIQAQMEAVKKMEEERLQVWQKEHPLLEVKWKQEQAEEEERLRKQREQAQALREAEAEQKFKEQQAVYEANRLAEKEQMQWIKNQEAIRLTELAVEKQRLEAQWLEKCKRIEAEDERDMQELEQILANAQINNQLTHQQAQVIATIEPQQQITTLTRQREILEKVHALILLEEDSEDEMDAFITACLQEQRSIAWILLVGFFLQNCTNLQINHLPQDKIGATTEHNKDQQLSLETSVKIASEVSGEEKLILAPAPFAHANTACKHGPLATPSEGKSIDLPQQNFMVPDAPKRSMTPLTQANPSEGKHPIKDQEVTKEVPLAAPIFFQHQPFLTADGYQVQFFHQNHHWMAHVKGSWASDREKWLEVPIHLAPGITLSQVSNYSPWLKKKRIHMLFDPVIKNAKVPIGVYIGPGLLGGAPTTKLHEAIGEGDVKEANRLLDTSSSSTMLHAQDEKGATPLHRATCYTMMPDPPLLPFWLEWEKSFSSDHCKLIKKLVRQGADINAKDHQEQTPLHWVMMRYIPTSYNKEKAKKSIYTNGRFFYRDLKMMNDGTPDYDSIIRKLIALKADINAQDERGYTPLHLAVENNNLKAITLLLELGVDEEIRNIDGNTPFHLAINLDYTQIAKQFIDSDAWLNIKDGKGNEILHNCILKKNQTLGMYLVAKNYFPLFCKNNQGMTPIDYASFLGQLDDIRTLLKIHPDKINYTDLFTGLGHLHHAVQRKDASLTRILLDLGCNKDIQEQPVNSQGKPLFYHRTPLHMAVEQEDLPTIYCLLKAGARKDIKDKDGKTAIDYAFKKLGTPKSIELIKAFAIPAGHPLLQERLREAIQSNDLAKVKQWAEVGADINLPDVKGNTPLHQAVVIGDEQIVKYFLSKKINKDAINHAQQTPLHVATLHNHIAIASLLLQLGADKDIPDQIGDTPLHVAATQGHIELVKQLIRLGANKSLPNKAGLLPIHLMITHASPTLTPQLIAALSLKEAEKEAHLTIALHGAVLVGKTHLVKELLHLGALLDGRNPLQETPLQVAINRGDLEMVNFLLVQGANLEVTDLQENTPLHQAIAQGNVPMVARLVAQGANKQAKNKQGIVPVYLALTCPDKALSKQLFQALQLTTTDLAPLLHEAVVSGNLSLARSLLQEEGADQVDKNATDATKWTPLHHATALGNVAMVALLLSAGVTKYPQDVQGNTPLHLAVQNGHVAVVKLLGEHDHCLVLNSQGNSPLHIAVLKKDTAIVDQLLKAQVYQNETNQTGDTPLHLAISIGHKKIIEMLLKVGADLQVANQEDLTPLELASKRVPLKMLRRILQQAQEGGAINQPDSAGHTHLHRAVKKKDLLLLKELIGHKAQVTATDGRGETPLHYAAAQGSVDILQTLAAVLPKGCNLDLLDEAHQTPLHHAMRGEHVEVVTWLLQQGADLHRNDKAGRSPLQWASKSSVLNTLLYQAYERGDEALVQQLCSLGIRLDTPDATGKTLLHHAAIHGQVSLIKTFISANAITNTPDQEEEMPLVHKMDHEGKTPLHYAALHGHEEAAIALIHAGADLQAEDIEALTPWYYALFQGNLALVEVLARAHEYKLTTQRCAERSASKRMHQDQDASHRRSETTSPLDHLVAHILPALPAAERIHWEEELLPVLQKHLAPTPINLQQKFMDYLENQGSVYPLVFQNHAQESWLIESLKLDLTKAAIDRKDALGYAKLKKSLQAVTLAYNQEALETVLTLLRKKQLQYRLNPTALSDVLTYLAPLSTRQAFQTLTIEDDDWFGSLRLAWTRQKAQQLTQFKPSERRKLGYVSALLPYEVTALQVLMRGLEHEKDFNQVEDFLLFLVKNQVPDEILLPAICGPALPGKSLLKTWKHQMGCALLKNILHQRYPEQTLTHLEQQLTTLLLAHDELYVPLQQLLTTKNTLSSDELTSLTHVIALINDYGLAPAVCKEILLLVTEKPGEDWEKLAHHLTIQATFGTSHERKAEEIMDFMVAHTPSTHFIKDRKALGAAYQGVEEAHIKRAKIYKGKKIISEWKAAEVQAWCQHVKEKAVLQKLTPELQQEAIAVIEKAVELAHGHKPRATQRLALLAFLNHAPGQGRLAQINTGEGKSLIVAMLAAFHALRGEKVDVTTTSSELSIPEVQKQTKFFSLLDLTVGENSTPEESAKKAIYAKDIVYGTASNFQGDILRTEFSGKDVRRDRAFGVVIVDEVDSMLFDSRTASIRLSGQTPAMSHLERLLASLYHQVHHILRHMIEVKGKTYYIQEDFKVHGDQITTLNGEELHMEPVEDKESWVTFLCEKHLKSLLRDLDSKEADELKAFKALEEKLVKGDLQAAIEKNAAELEKHVELEKRHGNYKREVEESKKEQKKLTEEYAHLEKTYNQHPWHVRDQVIEIPPHLKEFAIKQIPAWTKSAIQALCYLKKKLHYDVVDGKIVPIDYANTGVFQQMTVWGDGLSQMLQMKEGLPLHPENISTNFLSIPEYFKRYKNKIYGLTGTLGNTTTHQFLKQIYGVDLLVIPPYKHRPIAGNETSTYGCKELPAQVLAERGSWHEAIIHTNLSKAKHGRAVLIICKYVQEATELAKHLARSHDPKKIFTYSGEAGENFDKKEIHEGEIIIATNIAGRGTDITTSDAVEAHGGLHVCITFLPDNYRIELQNAGRTARQGKRGTAQLVIYDEEGKHIDTLRKLRNEQETSAIQQAQGDIEEMLFKDNLFKQFCALEEELLSSTEHTTSSVQLNRLWSIFNRCRLPSKIDRAYEQFILKKANELLFSGLKDQEIATHPAATADQALEALKEELYIKHPKTTFIEVDLKEKICAKVEGKYPGDVIEAFRQGKTRLSEDSSTSSDLVAGGKYERMALEEAWGLWLHHANKETKDHQQIQAAFDEFATLMRNRLKQHTLIQNPYHYVLQGNYLIVQGDYGAAVKAYDKAIALDELYSVNALYNKALALFKLGSKDDWSVAERALERAKLLIAAYHRPYLVSLNAMIGDTEAKPELLNHFKYQLDVLLKQEDYINAALSEIKLARDKEWNIEVSEMKPLDAVFSDDLSLPRLAAINKASIHGLDHFFVLKAKEPYPWKSIVALAIIGIAQIAAGAMIVACTGGALGKGFISEGVADLIAGVKAGIDGTFDWGKWAIQKAVSITVALFTSGIEKIKE